MVQHSTIYATSPVTEIGRRKVTRMKRTLLRGFIVALLFLTGCAGTGFPKGQVLPLSSVGLHLEVYEIVNHPNIAQRTAAYLDEIIANGKYAKELRIVFNKEVGPTVLREMIPVIRAKGFKILPILSMGNQMRPHDAASDLAWIKSVLPQVTDLLVDNTVQLANEQWHTKIDGHKLVPFPPAEFVVWHRTISSALRKLIPGIRFAEGDIDGGWDIAIKWWEAVEKAGGIDIDYLTWHVYTSEIPKTYGHPVWITEAGDIKDCVSPAVRCFVFTWNSTDRFAKRPGGGILP